MLVPGCCWLAAGVVGGAGRGFLVRSAAQHPYTPLASRGGSCPARLGASMAVSSTLRRSGLGHYLRVDRRLAGSGRPRPPARPAPRTRRSLVFPVALSPPASPPAALPFDARRRLITSTRRYLEQRRGTSMNAAGPCTPTRPPAPPQPRPRDATRVLAAPRRTASRAQGPVPLGRHSISARELPRRLHSAPSPRSGEDRHGPKFLPPYDYNLYDDTFRQAATARHPPRSSNACPGGCLAGPLQFSSYRLPVAGPASCPPRVQQWAAKDGRLESRRTVRATRAVSIDLPASLAGVENSASIPVAQARLLSQPNNAPPRRFRGLGMVDTRLPRLWRSRHGLARTAAPGPVPGAPSLGHQPRCLTGRTEQLASICRLPRPWARRHQSASRAAALLALAAGELVEQLHLDQRTRAAPCLLQRRPRGLSGADFGGRHDRDPV